MASTPAVRRTIGRELHAVVAASAGGLANQNAAALSPRIAGCRPDYRGLDRPVAGSAIISPLMRGMAGLASIARLGKD